MKRENTMRLSCLLIAVLVITSSLVITLEHATGVSEDETPVQSPWGSFGGDRRNTRRSPYDTSHVDGAIKWSVCTWGSFLRYVPAIDRNSVLYVHGKRTLDVIDTRDGSNIRCCRVKNISTIIEENGMIYAITHEIPKTEFSLSALNPNGTLKWKYFLNDVITSSTVCPGKTIYIVSDLGFLHSEDQFNIYDEENDSQQPLPNIFRDINNAVFITLLVFLVCISLIGIIFIMSRKKKYGAGSRTMILKKRYYRLDETTYNHIFHIGSVLMVVGVFSFIVGYVLSLGEPLIIIGIAATAIGAYSALMSLLGYKEEKRIKEKERKLQDE